ncbi:EF hand [Bremerella volcania]|uniref:EF hand n=1 Tax=Bremerella volcania TaxID=2527984 RepID=A0A518C8D4_9BACT|nr:EF-hand domain-containing protein [Bremerella volcania]QDU75483.1 EF hand [Bremerella volcania]
MRNACLLIGFALVTILPRFVFAQETFETTVVQMTTGDQIEAWALTIQADGQPVAKRAGEATAALFHFYDLNNDQRLDEVESQTIASPAGLRQLPLGRLLPTMVQRPTDIDPNEDGLITLDEFQTYYAAFSKAGLWLTSDVTPRNAEMNAALLRAMAIMPGDKVDPKRIERSMMRLMTLDMNADELISPGELLPRHVYPGVTPTRLVSGDNVSVHSFGIIQVRQGNAAACDHHWAINLSPDGASLQDLSSPQTKVNALTSTSIASTARLHVTTPSNSRAEASLAELASQFASSAGEDNEIKLSEIAGMQNQVDLENLIPLADRNRDDVLTAQEFAQWQVVVQAYIGSVVVVAILDFEQNLFTALDENFDGSLSAQELSEAWEVLQSAGVVQAGRLVPRQLPRQLRFVISQGPSQKLLDQGPTQGPAWFQALDRNRDGQISRDEFPASAEKFSAMDRDDDGFLSLKDIAPSTDSHR